MPTLSVSFMDKEDKERSVGEKEQRQGGEHESQQHLWQPPRLQWFTTSKDQTKQTYFWVTNPSELSMGLMPMLAGWHSHVQAAECPKLELTHRPTGCPGSLPGTAPSAGHLQEHKEQKQSWKHPQLHQCKHHTTPSS